MPRPARPSAMERVGSAADRGFTAVEAQGNSGTAGEIGRSRTRRFAKPRAGARKRVTTVAPLDSKRRGGRR